MPFPGTTFYLFGPADYSTYPLREVVTDDNNPAVLYEGDWEYIERADWPNGCSDDHFHLARNRYAQPGDPPTWVTLPAFEVAGTPEEGWRTLGASEDGAPLELWLKAQQGPNQNWQFVTLVNSNIPYLGYIGDPATGDLSLPNFASNRPPGAGTQSSFNQLALPCVQVLGLPAGSYVPRLVKQSNTGNNPSVASYLDTYSVTTRIP